MIIVNFKNYVYGKKSLELVKEIKKQNPKIIFTISPVDVRSIEYYTKARIFSQNVDLIKDEKSTGFINPRIIKHAKAEGTLLNHSEHKIPIKDIKLILKECKKINLKVVICSTSPKETKEIKKFKPWAIAFEDPKLIATGKSITKYDSKKIKEFVKILEGEKIIPLCGAGISSKEDYKEALNLGCKGVLISSAVMKSKNPGKFLRDFKLK